MVVIGCTHIFVTQNDLIIFDKIKLKYNNLFEFKLIDMYLIIKSKKEGNIDKKLIESIFKEFFFNKDGQFRNDTGLTYLNIYDHKNKFQYQLYYNPERKILETSNVEYY